MGESTVTRDERDVWNELIRTAGERDQTLLRIAALEAEVAELRLYKSLVSKDWDWKRVQRCEMERDAALVRAESAESALAMARKDNDTQRSLLADLRRDRQKALDDLVAARRESGEAFAGWCGEV